MDSVDFEEFNAEEMMHIAISVKDFRNMVVHADTVKTSISAMYSQPSRPLQFVYGKDGMRCEYTLMTIGDFRSAATPAPSRGTTREPQGAKASTPGPQTSGRSNPNMPPPQRPITRSNLARSVNSNDQSSKMVRLNADPDPDSLFLPEDDDNQWEPLDQREEQEDTLGWDASAENVSISENRLTNY